MESLWGESGGLFSVVLFNHESIALVKSHETLDTFIVEANHLGHSVIVQRFVKVDSQRFELT